MLALAGRPEHIATLISGVDRYNPSNVHLLEDYLQQQLANDEYDLLANLALLKLYQFNPTSLSPSAALSILFLTLSHAPFSPDFNLAWSLLSDSFVNGAALPPVSHSSPDSDSDDDDDDDSMDGRRQSKGGSKLAAQPRGEKETAELLKQLSSLLHSRQTGKFWSTVESKQENVEVERQLDELKKSSKGWEQIVRVEIAKEVELSFRSIKQEILNNFLGTQDLSQIAQSRNWTINGSDVQLPSNDSNTPKSSVTHERIEVEQLARLLGRSQA